MNDLNPVRDWSGVVSGSLYLYCVLLAHSPAFPFMCAVYAEDEGPLCVTEFERQFKIEHNIEQKFLNLRQNGRS
jgi:hypothetical protein